MDWSTDRQLRRRMAATLLALAATLLVATLAVWVVVGLVVLGVAGVVGLSAGTPLAWRVFVVGGGVCTLALLCYVAYRERGTPEYAVAATGARPVERARAPQLVDTVRVVAQQVDAPVPDVYLASTETPLSLVTGYGESDARLVVSSGLLEAVDDRQLAAVVAHELAHVKNRDVAVVTAAGLLTSAAARVFELLRGPSAGVDQGRVSRATYADAVVTVGLLLAAPVWGLSRLLVASLSRSREFAADRGAVAIAGDPAALAGALRTVDDRLADGPATDLRSAVATLSIVDPRSQRGRGSRSSVAGVVRRFVATHPPTDERVARLRALERRRETREDGPTPNGAEPAADT